MSLKNDLYESFVTTWYFCHVSLLCTYCHVMFAQESAIKRSPEVHSFGSSLLQVIMIYKQPNVIRYLQWSHDQYLISIMIGSFGLVDKTKIRREET